MSYPAARFQLVDLLVRGVDSALSLRIEQNGAAVTPSALTVSVYRPDGSALVSAASVTPAATSSYTVAAATTAQEALGDAWRVEWTATVGGVPTVYRNEAALVRTKLHPVITDTDLYNIASGLDPTSPTALTSETTYSQWRDEAWNQINARIIGQGQRPWLVMSPVAIRDAHLYPSLALIFEDLATRLNEAYEMRAASYRRHYEAAWTRLNFRYDADELGQLVDDDRRRSSRGPTFLSGGRRSWLY